MRGVARSRLVSLPVKPAMSRCGAGPWLVAQRQSTDEGDERLGYCHALEVGAFENAAMIASSEIFKALEKFLPFCHIAT